MEVFVCAGSGEGIGRTTASLLLACGFFEMGLEPLLIQVLASGEPPALRADEEAPFETARLVLADASSIGSEIKDLAGRHTELGPVIVDLPAQLFPEELLCDPRSRFLLPMMTDKAAIQRVVGDMLDVAPASTPGSTTIVTMLSALTWISTVMMSLAPRSPRMIHWRPKASPSSKMDHVEQFTDSCPGPGSGGNPWPPAIWTSGMV